MRSLKKIISGGQTGVDQAVLKIALAVVLNLLFGAIPFKRTYKIIRERVKLRSFMKSKIGYQKMKLES